MLVKKSKVDRLERVYNVKQANDIRVRRVPYGGRKLPSLRLGRDMFNRHGDSTAGVTGHRVNSKPSTNRSSHDDRSSQCSFEYPNHAISIRESNVVSQASECSDYEQSNVGSTDSNAIDDVDLS